MKSYFGLAPIAILVLALTFVLLPTSEAKRNDRAVRHSRNAGSESFLDLSSLDKLFKLDKREQGGAGQNQTQTMTVGWSIKNAMARICPAPNRTERGRRMAPKMVILCLPNEKDGNGDGDGHFFAPVAPFCLR